MKKEEKRLIDMDSKELEDMMEKCFNTTEKTTAKLDFSKDLMQRNEVAKMFSISLPTLHKWNRNNVLPKPFKLGGVVYYRRSELEKLINSNGK